MKNRWTFVAGLALVALHTEPSMCADLKSSWSLKLRESLSQKDYWGRPGQNRTCGIVKWDNTHILIYYLSATRHLVNRSPIEGRGGGWTFSILIVRTDDGQVDQSAAIPAGSFKSELALVVGGIVVSDPDRLVAYSRAFKRIDPAFTYAPLYPRTLHLSDPELLLTTDDQKNFVLVDVGGHRSHFFLFDGTTFEMKRDWTDLAVRMRIP